MANYTNAGSPDSNSNPQDLRPVDSSKYLDKSDKMWAIAYRQGKKYGSYDTAEPDWGPDIESTDFD